jgi:hypothetical protein
MSFDEDELRKRLPNMDGALTLAAARTPKFDVITVHAATEFPEVLLVCARLTKEGMGEVVATGAGEKGAKHVIAMLAEALKGLSEEGTLIDLEEDQKPDA